MKFKQIRRNVEAVSESTWHDNFLRMDEYKLNKCDFIINKDTPQEQIYKDIISVKLFKRGFMVLSSLDEKYDSCNVDYNDVLTFTINNSVTMDQE